MDFSSPLNGVMRTLDAAFVSALARTADGLTGRRIEATIGSNSRSGLRSSLARLQGVGLVHRTDIGNSSIFRINREHVFWAPIESGILGTPVIIEQDIAGLFEGRRQGGFTVAIFGSVARGESGLESDLDIVVVSLTDDLVGDESWDTHLAAVADLVLRRSGTSPQIVDVELSRLRAMVQSSDPLIASWYEEARTILGSRTSVAHPGGTRVVRVPRPTPSADTRSGFVLRLSRTRRPWRSWPK